MLALPVCEHSSLSAGLGLPCDAAGCSPYPVCRVCDFLSVDSLLTPPSFCHPGAGSSIAPRVFLCSCSDSETSCWIAVHWGPLINLIRFGHCQARLPLCGHSILLGHWHVTPGHPSVELFSAPCTGCEFPLPDHLFQGALSLPFWGSETLLWATLLNG